MNNTLNRDQWVNKIESMSWGLVTGIVFLVGWSLVGWIWDYFLS